MILVLISLIFGDKEFLLSVMASIFSSVYSNGSNSFAAVSVKCIILLRIKRWRTAKLIFSYIKNICTLKWLDYFNMVIDYIVTFFLKLVSWSAINSSFKSLCFSPHICLTFWTYCISLSLMVGLSSGWWTADRSLAVITVTKIWELMLGLCI